MTPEMILAAIAIGVTLLGTGLAFAVLIWKGGQWAGEAKQRSKDFNSRLVQMAEYWESEIDRLDESTHDAHLRIDQILLHPGGAPP